MQLFCPLCREPQANVTVNIADREQFFCCECQESFTRDDVTAMLDGVRKWNAILAWCDACPSEAEVETAAKVA